MAQKPKMVETAVQWDNVYKLLDRLALKVQKNKSNTELVKRIQEQIEELEFLYR